MRPAGALATLALLAALAGCAGGMAPASERGGDNASGITVYGDIDIGVKRTR